MIEPRQCLICLKGPWMSRLKHFTTLQGVRRHMLLMHNAYLGYDPIDKEWCYIYA